MFGLADRLFRGFDSSLEKNRSSGRRQYKEYWKQDSQRNHCNAK
jgi:hypothetical protein